MGQWTRYWPNGVRQSTGTDPRGWSRVVGEPPVLAHVSVWHRAGVGWRLVGRAFSNSGTMIRRALSQRRITSATIASARCVTPLGSSTDRTRHRNVQCPMKCFVKLAAVAVVLSCFSAEAQTSSRTYLIFVDDLHIRFSDSPQLRHVVQQVSRELPTDGSRWAMVSTGPSSVSVPPTSDWSALNAQIARLTGAALRPAHVASTLKDTDGAAEAQRRAAVTSATLMDVVKGATSIQGEKAILYVGSAGTGMAVANPTAIANASMEAAIPIHTIDLHSPSAAPPSSIPLTDWNEHVSSTAATIRMLAKASGGVSASRGDPLDSLLRTLRGSGIARP